MIRDGTERSFQELIADLAHGTGDLIHKEVKLAQAELSEKISSVGTALGSMVFGAVLALAGLMILLNAAVYALIDLAGLQPWLAAVIVGGVVALIGVILLMSGKGRLKPENLAPRRTVQSLRQDANLVKEKIG